MSYLNAKKVLPQDIITLIQAYVQGESLYIPKKECNRQLWGQNTTTRTELERRNRAIWQAHNDGLSSQELAQTYFLSIKSIQRILRQFNHTGANKQ